MFKMRPEVDEWFRHIFKQGPIQTKFDLYYLCLMMGLATGKAESTDKAVEFVAAFVSDYKMIQRLVLGLLIVAEASRLGLELGDRSEIETLMKKYLDSSNPAQLTDEGFSRLNEYAAGGLIAITEGLQGAKPHQVETFLQWYSKNLQLKMNENPHWAAFRESGKETTE